MKTRAAPARRRTQKRRGLERSDGFGETAAWPCAPSYTERQPASHARAPRADVRLDVYTQRSRLPRGAIAANAGSRRRVALERTARQVAPSSRTIRAVVRSKVQFAAV